MLMVMIMIIQIIMKIRILNTINKTNNIITTITINGPFVACADPATPMAFTPKPPQMNSGSSTTLRA